MPALGLSLRVGHNEIIGVCSVGISAEGLGRDHWNEMLAYPRKPIAHWHSLVEVKKSFKEVGEVTLGLGMFAAWPSAAARPCLCGSFPGVGGAGATCFSPSITGREEKEENGGKPPDKTPLALSISKATLNSKRKIETWRKPSQQPPLPSAGQVRNAFTKPLGQGSPWGEGPKGSEIKTWQEILPLLEQ